MNRARRFLPLWFVLGTFVVIGLLAVGFVWSGVYDIGADTPHSVPVKKALQSLRERSIAVRAQALELPPGLDDGVRAAAGASHYAEMCAVCHLAPGMLHSELRDGLYPQPPSLIEPTRSDPRTMFWVIKHGIKMSAMPAWGKSHDDDAIWSIVAFVRQLPSLSPSDYRALAGEAPLHDGHVHPGVGTGSQSDHVPTQADGAGARAHGKAKQHSHHDHRH
jgi:mono/diheme cytochrome c family protein